MTDTINLNLIGADQIQASVTIRLFPWLSSQ
jgi:hypothetical protein